MKLTGERTLPRPIGSIGPRTASAPLIATVPRDNPGERTPRQKIHQLAKASALFTGASSETLRKSARSSSNRHHLKIAKTAFKIIR